MMMETRTLGQTGLPLTELGFGGGAIANLYRPVSRDAAMATMQAAWDAGIRYFDTAPFYGHGLSERRVGDFLRNKEGWLLSTKVGKLLSPVPRAQVPDHGFVNPLPFDVSFDYSGAGLRRSVEASFARLGLNRIDILWVHDLEPRSLGDSYPHHLKQFLGTGLPELEKMKQEGLIRAFGLGVNEVSPCLDVLQQGDLDAILMAGRYTLLDRRAESHLLPLCLERGIGLVVGGVFNSGILATGAQPGAMFDYGPADASILKQVRALEGTAAAAGIPLARGALQFPLRHPSVASVLIGTAKPSSLARNLSEYVAAVPDGFWAAVDQIINAPLAREG
jgi:D-threo-aldose 1-dehydrogenase